MNKNLKNMISIAIILFIVFNFFLSVSFAAVNSGYNETGMSPTSPSSPSQSTSSPSSPMSPSTSPSESPSSPTHTQPTTSPTSPTTPSQPTQVNPIEYTAFYLDFQLTKIKGQRKLLEELAASYETRSIGHPENTKAYDKILSMIYEEEKKLDIESELLNKLVLDLVPPTP